MSHRCPQCEQPIDFRSDVPPKELRCSSCGTAFVQASDDTITFVGDGDDDTVTYVRVDLQSRSRANTLSGTGAARILSSDYELLEEIARGGMGVVYKARHIPLNRTVALKMIKSGELAGEEEIQRFYAEAEAAAGLDHANIVPVYEVGDIDGQHFFSMGFVAGESLEDRIKDGPLPVREAAGLVRTIAEAVQFAHDKGIVHRDLKPSNVMIDGDGKPRITDFGLAKRTEADSSMTATGQILGTPSYMSPEQAAGATDQVGPLSDVYSLGAVLYRVLTGRPVFQAANAVETLRQVLQDEPVSPRQLNPDVPKDLETICLKCLQKASGRRYESAAAVADDLHRFLDGHPIVARPIRAWERFAKWARRHPGVAGVSAVSIVLTAVFVALILVQLHEKDVALGEKEAAEAEASKRADEANQSALKEKNANILAQEKARETERTAYFTTMALGFREWESGFIRQARSRLAASPEALRNWEWHLLNRLCRKELLSVRPHKSPVTALAVSPDGKQIATATWDLTIHVWNSQTGQRIHTLRGHLNVIDSLAFSPDGKRLAAAGVGELTSSGDIRVYELASGFEQLQIPAKAQATSIQFSPDGRRLLVGGWDRVVRILDSTTGKELRTFVGHLNRVLSVAFHPAGKLIASSDSGGTVRIWNVGTASEMAAFLPPPRVSSPVQHVAFSPDGKWLATAGGYFQHGEIRLWDVSGELPKQSREPSRMILGHENAVRSVAFSPDSKRMVSGSEDRHVKLWDVETGREIRKWNAHDDAVWDVVFHPDGEQFVSSGHDGSMKIWKTTDESQSVSRVIEYSYPTVVAFSPDGTRFASGSTKMGTKAEVAIFDTETGKPVHQLWDHKSSVLALAYSPDGRLLASGGADRRIILWDTATGKTVRTMQTTEDIHSLSFHPDGELLASNGPKSVMIWKIADGTVHKRLLGYQVSPRFVAFSPDGKLLASSNFSVAHIWDVSKGAALVRLSNPGGVIGTVDWSPNGKLLAVAGKKINLWDVEKKKMVSVINGVAANLRFSPDSNWLISTNDKEVQLWNVAMPDRPARFRGHVEHVRCVAWHPDGERFLSCSDDGSVKLWHRRLSQRTLNLKAQTAAFACISRNGRLVAAGGQGRDVIVWNVPTGDTVQKLTDHATAGFNPCGGVFRDVQLVTAAQKGSRNESEHQCEVKVWHIAKRQTVSQFVTPGRYLGFNHDGTRLAVARKDHSLELVDTSSGKKQQVISGFSNYYNKVAFSPDGNRIAVAIRNVVRVFDASTGQKLYSTRRTSQLVSCVNFSSDGRILVTGYGSFTLFRTVPGSIRIWNAETGDLIRTVRGHDVGVDDVAFHPNGKRIASISRDQTLKLWDVDSGHEVLTLRLGGVRIRFDEQGDRLYVSDSGGIHIWDGRQKTQ